MKGKYSQKVEQAISNSDLTLWWLGLSSFLTTLTGIVALGQYINSGEVDLGGMAVLSDGSAQMVAWSLIGIGGGLMTFFLLDILSPRQAPYFFRRFKCELASRPWPNNPDRVSEALAGYAARSGQCLIIEEHVVIELEGVECVLLAGFDARELLLGPEAERAHIGVRSYFFHSPMPFRTDLPEAMSEAARQRYHGREGCVYEILDLKTFFRLLNRHRRDC